MSGPFLQTTADSAGSSSQSLSTVQTFGLTGHVSLVGELKKVATTNVPLTSQESGPSTSSSAQTRNPEVRTKPTGTANAVSFGLSPPVVTGDSIVNSPGGATRANGVNAFDNFKVNGVDYEPPDQGLCVGNGYVMDAANTVLRVYTTSFAGVSSDISPNTIDGLPLAAFTSDPRCLYDQNTGHWFLIQLFINFNGLGQGYEYVAVSATSKPWGIWNVYALNVTDYFPRAGSMSAQTNDPGCPCFGDQPLLGASADALAISTNEFSIFGPTFNGAQIYLIDKQGLAEGDEQVSFVHLNALTVPTPDGTCFSSGGVFCWYSVNPAGSPEPSQYDNINSGTEYAMSSLDFQGIGDNRLALWGFTNLASLRGTPSVSFRLKVYGGLESYLNPLGPNGNAFLAPQKAGPYPAGEVVYSSHAKPPVFGCKYECPEGLIQSNGDGMFDNVVYSQGALWGAVDTLVGIGGVAGVHAGVAYWVVRASGNSFAILNQGYVAAKGEDIVYPSVGVGPAGDGVIAFSLTGEDYYPSTAYGFITMTSTGLVGRQIFVADLGMSPYDATTEYQCISGSCSTYFPRFGDYSWSVWSGGKVYFSTEFIQFPNCGEVQYRIDPTCSSTRGPLANWGTSINSVTS